MRRWRVQTRHILAALLVVQITVATASYSALLQLSDNRLWAYCLDTTDIFDLLLPYSPIPFGQSLIAILGTRDCWKPPQYDPDAARCSETFPYRYQVFVWC